MREKRVIAKNTEEYFDLDKSVLGSLNSKDDDIFK